MERRPLVVLAIVSASLLATIPSAAQEATKGTRDGVRMDQLQPAPPESSFVRAEGPHTPRDERVEFAVGLTGDYMKGPIRALGVDVEGGETELGTPVTHAFLLSLASSITPVHWLSFDIAVPFALLSTGDVVDQTFYGDKVPEAAAPAIGDPRLGVHVRPVDTQRFGLIAGGRFWLPIGSEAYLSDKEPRFEIDLGVAGERPTMLYGITLSVAPLFFNQRPGDRIAVSVAAHLVATSWLSAGLEPAAMIFADPHAEAADYGILVEPLGAARIRLGDFRIGLAAGPGFGRAAGTPELRGVLQLAYVGGGEPEKPGPKPPADSDLDKIPDSRDACPNEAGPDSKDPEKRGCPSQDRDGDGVRDDEDWCPDRPGIKHEDPKASGCPDSDNDQLPDPIDQCRAEPGAGDRGGCPKFARLQKEGFRLDPPITFDGKSFTVTGDGKAALEEIAATMRANPKLEQVSISLGTKGVRPELSDKRAQQIILVFRLGNLDSNRYEIVLRDDLKAGVVEVRLIR